MRSNSVRSQEEKGLFVLLEAVEEGRADLKLAGVAIDIHTAHTPNIVCDMWVTCGEKERKRPPPLQKKVLLTP